MANETVGTYDPGAVVFTFGPHIASGYAKDSLITARRVNPGFTVYEGADGSVCRAANRSKLGKILLRLSTHSKFNDVLSAYFHADEAQPGAGIQACMLKDASGTSIASGKAAWVAALPDMEKAREIGEVEWEIDVAKLEMHVGGTL